MKSVLPPDVNDLFCARARRIFWLGCAAEAGLGFLAVVFLEVQGVAWRSLFAADQRSVLLGLLATLPFFLLFQLGMRVRSGPLAPIRLFLEYTLRPMLSGQRWWHLLLLSVLAGFSEELFFRGAVQGWLGQHLGELPALLIASALFGIAHGVNLAYAVVAGLMGVGLGGLWLGSGSLVTVMITHALYDFLALLWLLERSPLRSAADPAMDEPDRAKSEPSRPFRS